MSFLDSAGDLLLARYLDLSAMRQSLITSNIANIDTPGYRTRDIDFHGELQRALEGDASGTTEPVVREVQGLIARPDGNNVSIDRESMLLSEVQLQFSAAEQLLKSDFKTLNMAINEGSGGS
jgi:flagellar basal-body rod protein FlgB